MAISDAAPAGWRRPNIYDVADHAGVSHMTVSRVLNDNPQVSGATRRRVLEAIDELRYTPSSIARALATRRAMRIGVIIDAPVQYGPNSTLHAIEGAARAAGYAISSYSISDAHETQIPAGITELVAQGVEALCVIAPRASSLEILRSQLTDLPTLALMAEPDSAIRTAAVDQYAGAVLAVTHLIGLGHRDILHLAGPPDWFDARTRANGWRDTLEEAGLRVAPPVIGDWSSDFGYEFGLGHDLRDATAIFAANDQMALGLVRGLTDRGLRVPGDISVVGFDDLPDAKHYCPPLTTIRQDFAALGSLALASMIAAIDGAAGAEHAVIAPTLIVRASTGPPPA